MLNTIKEFPADELNCIGIVMHGVLHLYHTIDFVFDLFHNRKTRKQKIYINNLFMSSRPIIDAKSYINLIAQIFS